MMATSRRKRGNTKNAPPVQERRTFMPPGGRNRQGALHVTQEQKDLNAAWEEWLTKNWPLGRQHRESVLYSQLNKAFGDGWRGGIASGIEVTEDVP